MGDTYKSGSERGVGVSVCSRIVKKGRSVGGSGWAQESGEEYVRACM